MKTKYCQQSIIAAAISTVLLSSTSSAEEVLDKNKEIEQISVWSTQVNASSLYLKGDEISNKQADHVSDLLRTIPGVDVGGAHSLNQRITIRSMDDKDLNISIDGAKQNTYMYHHMGNLQIHADILKSVDIEIGTNSVINGGLGGAVRFETKQARDLLGENEKFGGRLQISAGDNSSSNYSLTGYGLLTDDVDFIAYYNYVDRDNYDVGGGTIKDASGTKVEGTDGTVRGLEGEVDDVLIKFGWNIDDDQRIQVSYESYTDEGDYSYRPDMGLATDIAITESLEIPLLWPTEFTRDTLTLNYDLTMGSTNVKAAVYSTTSELWRDESGYAQNPSYVDYAGIVTGEATNTGANIIAETSIDGEFEQDITYGIDYVKHETDYNAAYTTAVHASEEATNLALFIQDRIALNETITLIPGVRYDSYDIDSTVVDDEFSDVSFALAVEYQASNNLLFKLSATELFKGPEISEVFVGAGLYETANQGIDAETGTNIELAFAYQGQVLGADQFSIGATFFKTHIEGYIYDYAIAPDDAGSYYWKDNIGDMDIDGFEVYLGYEIGAFNSSITFSQAESELEAFESYSDFDGARLDRQQGDTVSAHASYEIASMNLLLNWEMLYVDDVEAGLDLDGAGLDNSKDSYTVHNFSATWSPESLQGLAIIIGADNVFDEFYASQSSRTGVSYHPRFGELYLQDYEPGRNLKATVSYQF